MAQQQPANDDIVITRTTYGALEFDRVSSPRPPAFRNRIEPGSRASLFNRISVVALLTLLFGGIVASVCITSVRSTHHKHTPLGQRPPSGGPDTLQGLESLSSGGKTYQQATTHGSSHLIRDTSATAEPQSLRERASLPNRPMIRTDDLIQESTKSQVRNCTSQECQTYHCHPTTPFACVEGSARLGCAKDPDAFEDSPACSSQCDLRGCHALQKPCGECTETDCIRLAPTCGLTQPFVCVEGPANGGCSDTEDTWPNVQQIGICPRCCDLHTCPTPARCKPCEPSECLQVGHCAADEPYACVVGNAAGGCAAKESYWTDAEFRRICLKCCDTEPCHSTAG